MDLVAETFRVYQRLVGESIDGRATESGRPARLLPLLVVPGEKKYQEGEMGLR